jgi:hypothetical protein
MYIVEGLKTDMDMDHAPSHPTVIDLSIFSTFSDSFGAKSSCKLFVTNICQYYIVQKILNISL